MELHDLVVLVTRVLRIISWQDVVSHSINIGDILSLCMHHERLIAQANVGSEICHSFSRGFLYAKCHYLFLVCVDIAAQLNMIRKTRMHIMDTSHDLG